MASYEQPEVTSLGSTNPKGPELATPKERRHLWLRLGGALLFVALVVAVWRFTPLGEIDSVDRAAAFVRSLRTIPFAPLYVTGTLVVGTLLFLPSTLLIFGTVLALGPLQGGACALFGALTSAALGYGIGRVLGQRPLDRFSSPRFRTLQTALRTRGFRTTLVARFLPLGNFTVINLLAGSLAVPFRAFMLGNLAGLTPAVLAFSLFAHELVRFLD